LKKAIDINGFFHIWADWYAIRYAAGSWLRLDHFGHQGACKWRASAPLVRAVHAMGVDGQGMALSAHMSTAYECAGSVPQSVLNQRIGFQTGLRLPVAIRAIGSSWLWC